MARLRRIGLVLALGLTLTLVAPSPARAQVVKHSGVLLDVDPEAGAIVLAEFGPWRLDAETTVITVWAIIVPRDTEFVLVRRLAEEPDGFAGAVVTEELEPWTIHRGDFAIVDCLHRGDWTIALRIVIVEDDAP
jgi:hypothetical protein